MKKLFVLVLMLLVMPLSVYADDIYSVDMKINISKDGSASITEVMDVEASGGSEWYKQFKNLRGSEISNFVVYMDGVELEYKEWDVSESLTEKAGYYGINKINDGIELCFGKSDMARHTFTLKYNISNYIFNTSDSQILYWTLLPNVTTDNFSIEIISPYEFMDTDNVWGYGYKGYVSVDNGNIKMYDDGKLNNDYVVLLAKYPLGTFDTTYTISGFDNFDDVYQMAEDGSYTYDYENLSGFDKFMNFFGGVLNILIDVCLAIGLVALAKRHIDSRYGYVNNKKIDKKNVPMYRDIPCNKDIYYANVLIKLNNFGYKQGNIIGAIILKWVRDGKIKFKNEKTGVFNRETSVIDLTNDVKFSNEMESKLFNMMKEASKDGLLEARELEKWCRKNYTIFFDLIEDMEDKVIFSLEDKEHIYTRVNKDECKCKNVMDEKIYNDSVELYGLKLYLEEFSRMDTKEVMDVKLWDEYLMFAYLFGIADKVTKQLNKMYPEVLQQDNFNYDTLIFVNNLSMRGVNAASGAKYSSGGGGGGSSGGGGSMGGR